MLMGRDVRRLFMHSRFQNRTVTLVNYIVCYSNIQVSVYLAISDVVQEFYFFIDVIKWCQTLLLRPEVGYIQSTLILTIAKKCPNSVLLVSLYCRKCQKILLILYSEQVGLIYWKNCKRSACLCFSYILRVPKHSSRCLFC
jgi:hypothetical protein